MLGTIRTYLSPKNLSLAGALTYQFAASIIFSWGSTSVYFLSYLQYYYHDVDAKTNSIILLSTVVPMIIISLLTQTILSKLGPVKTIRICSIIYLISPLFTIIKLNMITLVLFYAIIPGSLLTLTSISSYHCIWSHFPKSTNKVTALSIVVGSIGTSFWIFLFTHVINPDNQEASAHEGNDELKFFDYEVVSRVKWSAIVIYFIDGIIYFIGGLLITKKQGQNDMVQQQNAEKNQQITSQSIENNNDDGQQVTPLTLLKNSKSLLILITAFFFGLYQTYVLLNMKIIFMRYVNDDHFLSYCFVAFSLSSIIGTLGWGILGDWKGIAWPMLILTIIGQIFKFFNIFANQKASIIISLILIAFIDNGMVTLTGPGFVQIFGLQLGKKLLPYKSITLISVFMSVALFQFLFQSSIGIDGILWFLFILGLIACGSAAKFFYKYKFVDDAQKQCLNEKNSDKNSEKYQKKEQNVQNVPKQLHCIE